MSDTQKTEYQPHSSNAFMADVMLPCPCCGGEPELTFIGNPYTKSRKVTIKCKKCRLQRTDATIRNTAEWAANVAIEQWNKRA